MPPVLALILTVGLVIFLFARHSAKGDGRSAALWLPVMWLSITGSRFVSQWLEIFGLGFASGGGGAEGSPLDAAYFSALIVAGMYVLARRRIVMSLVVRYNGWLIAFFIYGFLAILWSDFPFVAFKRWVKTLGHPIMALIIATEPNPLQAVRTVLNRCAYLLIPFSVIAIKYFPHVGRMFDPWSGLAINNGVGLGKNDLGSLCWVFGLFFLWSIVNRKGIAGDKEKNSELLVQLGLLGMTLWLLKAADSSTAKVAFAMGAAAILALKWNRALRHHVTAFLVLGVVAVGLAQATFDLYGALLKSLGEDPTLTDRTYLWRDAIALQENPLLGAGFESFWLGERLKIMWAKWWWGPTQAHNGYIEIYLNLGIVGLVLLVGLLVSTFRKIAAQLRTEFELACLRLSLLFPLIAHNITEAGFQAVAFVWTIFYIVAIDYPARQTQTEGKPAGPATPMTAAAANRRNRARWGMWA